MTGEFQDVGAMLAALKPDQPFYAIRPRELRLAAQFFSSRFSGDVLYTVSANPHAEFLRTLGAGGIRHFAVATLRELRAVKEQFPAASCFFTQTVNSATSIRAAAHDYGVTHFAVDHADELAKIIVHTAPLKPMVIVRLAVPGNRGAYDSTGKFGCSVAEAAGLMRAAAAEGLGVGLGFRLERECRDPEALRNALGLVGDAARAASLQPEIIDVGAGFSCARRGVSAPQLPDYFNAIREGVASIGLHRPAHIVCAPDRALAASGASLVVRVELRRGNRLYLNDGIHGGLDALSFGDGDVPMRVWRANGDARLLPSAPDHFSFLGPTGDGDDAIVGPFDLPRDIRIGDYIEIGQMGAYSMNLRSDFGGSLSPLSVIVNDPALLF